MMEPVLVAALLPAGLLVGGMTPARAAEDEPPADRILAACRDPVDTAVSPGPSRAAPPSPRTKGPEKR
jgi:hypothetical protein